MQITDFLLTITAILVAAKLLGELAERLGQPAVLGELIAGVILGASVLGLVDPREDVIHLLSEVGVIILLFEIGLETDLKKLMRTGPAAATVAVVGVALPFALGFIGAQIFSVPAMPAVVAAAALTATSVGITARVLADLRRLHEPEGQIVLGAAVIDDVLGLIILSVVAGVMNGAGVTIGGIALTTFKAFAFIAAVLVAGRMTIPILFNGLEKIGKPATVAMMGLVLAFLLAVVADKLGSAFIIGAFTAGLVLQPTSQAKQIREGVTRLGHFFVPIFFVAVGAAVDVRSFTSINVVLLGLVLTIAGVIGKMAAGYAPWWFKGRKLVVGVAMVPRGEVGLIFAQMGLTAGVLNAGEYSAVMFMVMATTFSAPIALRYILKSASENEAEDAGGVADLTMDA